VTKVATTFICPRWIRGNRGDLLSRYGILSALHRMLIDDIVVFCDKAQDIYPLPFRTLPNGYLYNLLPGRGGFRELRGSDIVLWTAGLDLQDDSSLTKLLHTLVVFTSLRLMGLRICVLMQGAGPLVTGMGRAITRLILDQVELFVARDTKSLGLLRPLSRRATVLLGYDGIFLDGIGDVAPQREELEAINGLIGRELRRPVIGFNMRQWFHFASSILPYRFSRKRYLARSQRKMAEFVDASVAFLRVLRQQYDSRVVLISMYEPGVEWWENDTQFLHQIKQCFAGDDDIVLAETSLTLHGFCRLMARLDLMVGTRLHSSLTALRMGVPTINLNYTAKGRDILTDLGLADHIVELEDFLANPSRALQLVDGTLQSAQSRERASAVASEAIAANTQILRDAIVLASGSRT
jgi:polysaccharide pyruvyl transferase WcaK-like protein